RGLVIEQVSISYEQLGELDNANIPIANFWDERNSQQDLTNGNWQAGIFAWAWTPAPATVTFPGSQVNTNRMMQATFTGAASYSVVHQVPIVITPDNVGRPKTLSCLVRLDATVANPLTTQSYIQPYL